MNALSFDIETIPQLNPSPIQLEELSRKKENYSAKHLEEDDAEVTRLLMGTSPYFGQIICIGMGWYSDADRQYKSKGIIGDEPEILRTFWTSIAKFNGIFVSFNGLEFDVPFIIARSMKHRIKITNNNFLDTRRFQRFPHFDVKQVMSDWDRYRSCTLNLACDHLGIPSPKDGEIKAKDVADAYSRGEINKIEEYCLRDVKATLDIYEIVAQYVRIK